MLDIGSNNKESIMELSGISGINVLERVNFDKLEILNLKYTQLKDLNILEKVNFKYLK